MILTSDIQVQVIYNFKSSELLCLSVVLFLFLIFNRFSEMSDRTSCVSVTSNALFNLLPGNLGRPKLRTFKLSTSFFFVMGRWNAERFFCSFTSLFC